MEGWILKFKFVLRLACILSLDLSHGNIWELFHLMEVTQLPVVMGIQSNVILFEDDFFREPNLPLSHIRMIKIDCEKCSENFFLFLRNLTFFYKGDHFWFDNWYGEKKKNLIVLLYFAVCHMDDNCCPHQHDCISLSLFSWGSVIGCITTSVIDASISFFMIKFLFSISMNVYNL